MSPEQAKAEAERHQEEIMRLLFSFLTLTGPTLSASISPTTNQTTHEEETPRSRLN